MIDQVNPTKKISTNVKSKIESLFAENFHILLLLVIITAIFFLYLNKTRIPFFVAISSREAQTASQARYFFNAGIDLFRPKYDLTPTPQYLVQEFPIYQAVVAIIYHIAGFDEIWGKILSVLALVGSLCYMFLVSNHFLKNKYVSVIATIFFAIAPYTIRFYPVFMIDPTTVFLSLVTLYHGILWIEKKTRIDFWIFLVSGLFGFLIKFIFLIPISVPLFVLFVSSLDRTQKNELKRICQFFMAFVFWGITLLIWVAWSSYLNNQTTLQAFNDSLVQYDLVAKWFGTLDMRANPVYLDSLEWITSAFVPPWISKELFYALFVIGLGVNFLRSRRRAGIFLLSWTFGFFVIVLLFFPALSTHIYYWLPAIPIAVLSIVSIIDVIFTFFSDVVVKIKLSSNYRKIMFVFSVFVLGEAIIILGRQNYMNGFDLLSYKQPNQFDYYTGLITIMFMSLLWALVVYMILFKQITMKILFSILIIGVSSQTFYSNLFVANEKYWEIPSDQGYHWSTTPLLLQEANYIKRNHNLDEPIAIVTKYNYYPHVLYLSGARGYTLRYPEQDINAPCFSVSHFPVFLSNPCVSLLHEQGINNVFVIFYQEGLDMNEADFKAVAPLLHLELVDQMLTDSDQFGNVLHYRIDLP